jgi:hypothetical protein
MESHSCLKWSNGILLGAFSINLRCFHLIIHLFFHHYKGGSSIKPGSHWSAMFYDPLSVSNEEENAQNILCINDHRQWASPMFTINVNQALYAVVRALYAVLSSLYAVVRAFYTRCFHRYTFVWRVKHIYVTFANWHKNVDERWRIDLRRWRTDSWRNDSLAKRPQFSKTHSKNGNG